MATIKAYKTIGGKVIHSDCVVYNRDTLTNVISAIQTKLNNLDTWSRNTNVVLATPNMYMTGTHEVYFSQAASTFPHGICVVMRGYQSNGGVQNWDFHSYFIPNKVIEYAGGYGHIMMCGGSDGIRGYKYIYVHNDKIRGNDVNSGTRTSGGVEYVNSKYVVGWIIGM